MSIIRFRFTGDTTSLDKASKSAKKQLSQLKNEFKAGATQAAKWGAASSAAAALTAAAIFKSQSKVIDSLGKTADALGVNIEKLQALHHMAELNGVSSEAMSKNLQRMEMRLGEAIRKGGLAAQALSEVGVSLDDIREADPAQQMEMLAKAIGDVENQSVKASIASDIFGRDGLKMLKVLNNLERDGLAPTINELEKLGVSLSRVDAAKVEAANDAIFRSSQVIDGIGKKFTVEMAPIVEAFAQVFIESAKDADGFEDSIDSAFNAVIEGAGFALDAIDGVDRAFNVAGQAAATFALAVQRDALKMAQAIIDFPVKATNDLIALMNSVPGVDIDLVNQGQMSAAIQREMELAASAVEQGKMAINETLMAPLPSEAFKQFVEEAREASEEAAKAATEALGGGGDEVSTLGLGGNDREKLQARVDAIKEAYASEIELAREKFGEEQEVLQEALNNELLTKDEHRQLLLEAEQAYQNESTKILEDSEARKAAIEQAAYRERRQALGTALSNLTTLMNSESRKQFEIGKAAAIADTVISTYEGAQKAYTSLAGIPVVGPALGAAAASAAIAGGVARVNSIRSQSLGGSSTPSNTPTQSVNAASTPVSQGGGDAGGGGGTTTTLVELPPDAFLSGRQVARLLEEYSSDGGTLRVNLQGAN